MSDQADWFSRTKRAFIFGDSQPPWSFDAVVRESHSWRATITKNPVETGANISDHAYMEPAGLEIEAWVGDVWLHGLDQNGNPVDDIFGGVDNPAGRSVTCFEMLVNLMKTLEPFDVQTGLKLYENMAITQLVTETDAKLATVCAFRATLEQVIRVTTQTVKYPPRAPKKPTRQASKTVASGDKKSTAPTTEPQRQSIALQAFGKLFN